MVIYLVVALIVFDGNFLPLQLFWESDEQPPRRSVNVTFQESGNSTGSPGECVTAAGHPGAD